MVHMSDVPLSAGYTYFPEAFGTGMYELGSKIANDPRFYRLYVGFILKTLLDLPQLVHSRVLITREIQLLAPHASIVAATWCTLSLATDRYFDEKAVDYAWSDLELEQAKGQWLSLLAPAFVPSNSNRRLDIEDLRDWRRNVLRLHKRDVGPLAACEMCTSKCLYSYDVKVTDEKWWLSFDGARQHANAPLSVALLSLSLALDLGAKLDTDLAFCIAANSIKHQDSFEDTQYSFMSEVRSYIQDIVARETVAPVPAIKPPEAEVAPAKPVSEDEVKRAQILEVVVRVAMTGNTSWKELCEETMQAHKISVDEVEKEVERRRQSVNKPAGEKP